MSERHGLPDASVFVYGTLMPGQCNEHVARLGGAFTARPARLRGFALYHLEPEGYPGIVPAEGKSVVHGFVLTYQARDWPLALRHLDVLEGLDETPPLYHRVPASVDVAGGQQPAWVYVYARQERLRQSGALRVPGGDWTRRRTSSVPHGAS